MLTIRERGWRSASVSLDDLLHYLGTIDPGEDLANPEVRRAVANLRGRTVALLVTFHADIAQDSPRLRYALECWTGLNRAATRRWLRGDATRKATQEPLTSTLEHVLRTFGAPQGPLTPPGGYPAAAAKVACLGCRLAGDSRPAWCGPRHWPCDQLDRRDILRGRTYDPHTVPRTDVREEQPTTTRPGRRHPAVPRRPLPDGSITGDRCPRNGGLDQDMIGDLSP